MYSIISAYQIQSIRIKERGIMASRLIILLYVIATSAALISIKLGSSNGSAVSIDNNKLNYNLNAGLLLGIVLYGISFILYTYLISKYDLGYIIPLTTAIVYTIIFVASYFIFNEAFTAIKILGIILILSGVVLLNSK